ncbi:MAG: glycerophosphodiester phosphodiesterase family protein, partial [Pseudomonadota bacterium]
MKKTLLAGAALVLVPAFAAAEVGLSVGALSYGQRPAYLIDKMDDGPLKDQLQACLGQTPQKTDFSIGHRGAPLKYPEHTVESNVAAARQGAGILECDVTFTADKELVCRHAQNDLHTTTNMVASPLADQCTAPFTAASDGNEATAECRTSDITLAQFRTLTPKMDASDTSA